MIRILAILVSLLLAACSGAPTLRPYRIDIRQGNAVTQEMVSQLKPGQTRDQVKFILGSPLVADMFHADRWDYVYLFQPGRGEPEQRRLTVIFEDGKLVRLAGDVVAAERQADGSQPTQPASRVIEIPPAK